MPLKHSVEEIILKNGARGLLIHTPDTTAVRYDIQFRAGNDYAPTPEKSQVAHIMEHMSFGPNKDYASLEEFSRVFSRNGAYHNAWTSDLDMIYNVDAALLEWDRILDLQLLAIAEPRFNEQNLRAEKGNVREEITGYATNFGRLLWQTMVKEAGLKRWFDEDELTTIDVVTLDDINAHHKSTHTTNNMRFVIVGDLKEHADTIIQKLEAMPLPTGLRLPVKVDDPHATGPVYIQRNDSPSLTFDLFFMLKRRLNRRELRALNALNDIITGTMHSRIWGEARARGICYDMGTWIDDDPSGSVAWNISGVVQPSNAEELFKLIATQLMEIANEGITEDELQESKDARIGGLQMGTATVRSLAGWYGDYYYDTGKIDHVGDMPALIVGTTTEEIRQLASEFLHSSIWSFGALGNIEAVEFKKHYDKLAQHLNKG